MQNRPVVILLYFLVIGPAIQSLPSKLMADIFMYVDQNGVIHFTNVPTSSVTDYRVFIKESRQRGYFAGSSDKYDHIIKEASHRHGVAFPLLKAIIKAESGFNPRAISKKGALGLMQLMPKNVQLLQISDPFDPRENIMGGTRYLRLLANMFGGDMVLTISGYHAGEGAVMKYNGVPPYSSTHGYIKKVLKFYHHYKRKAAN